MRSIRFNNLNRLATFNIRNKSTMLGNSEQGSKLDIIPVAVYKDLISKKQHIFKDNKGRTGIYKWINVKTGDFYIGSAGDLHKRWVNYFNYKYIAGYKSKSIIYSSMLKNGYECLNLEILEYCDKKNS